ncbi:magnesium-transporting ATPase (P-type) [Oikeobacillus pervagus]|uniref:Magnesium-transporting ATPase (P-type) n=1 Tax=Oikeobacillus pervagus TaxID=1325931 RepID=A0AAJ1WKY5_9BACI|nr:hypothetical protein [Oikeobacillus pervagus]MDQ0215626.1 magnesium-transporting ATPase (P-type) [Oikeobacillus pervagus]
MKKNLSVASMISLIIAAVLIVISIFIPWWGMKFFAPQYPEGLDIIVYPTTLDGDIEVVNGLNHYIGMKEFSNQSFPELAYMPYIVISFAVLTLLVAFLRKKSFLFGLIILYVIGGIVGLLDMYRWLKKFGTELDPKAPIDLDPFVPPIIGENTIANFVTNSYFTYGGYLLGIVFILMIFPLWKDRKK